MCIDKYCSWSYLKQWIPSEYHHRILLIQEDITGMTAASLLQSIKQKWETAEWHKFVWCHGSPSCRSHSRADRGLSKHRDSAGRPLTALAKADDKALSSFIQIMLTVREQSPQALMSIENPVSPTFRLQPCIQKLRRQGWQWLTASYCKSADDTMDAGTWPKKNTNFLLDRVPTGFQLPIC